MTPTLTFPERDASRAARGIDSMRIMLVTTSMMVGGAETQVYLLARRFKELGHEVHVVSLTPPTDYQAELAAADIPLSSLHLSRGVPNPLGVLKLARLFRSWRPDVVHSHMVHANLFARAARPLSRVPVLVSTAHNYNEGARWRELAYRITDPLTTVSTNVCHVGVERYQRVGAVPPGRMVAMPNGIEIGAFERGEERRRRVRSALGVGDDFVWLAVGRLEPQKDIPKMLRSLSSLEGAPRTLLLVGEGPLRTELEGLRAELGLSEEQVRFLGKRTDVSELMSAADAYLMSSAWEGLPLVLIEAAAASLPIVATDVGGNSEILTDGLNGYLVDADDPDALARAMARMEALPTDLRLQMGAAGLERVREEFEIGAVAQRWLEFYSDLRVDGAAG